MKLKKPIKKSISLFLTLLFFVSIVPFSSFAINNTLIVDLNNELRDVGQYASGMLYSAIGEGQPSSNSIIPIKIDTVETGSNGIQESFAGSLIKNGVKKIQLLLCNGLGGWPYNWTNWNNWYDLIDEQVNMVLNSGYKDKIIYVPWNEGDWTWPSASGVSFNEGWKRMYNRIRALDSTTPIAGPAWSWYDGSVFSDFLTYCKNNNCVPNIFIWHELRSQTFYQSFNFNISDFRTRVANLGLSPIPVEINEYGSEKDMGVPGVLIQYISKFEREKIFGAQLGSYTHMNANGDLYDLLGDRLAASNIPNGAWWLYKWYADMTGKMLGTIAPSTNAQGLEGIASVDNNTKKMQVIFGGSSGYTTITVTNFNSRNYFYSTVHVRIIKTSYTAKFGANYQPEFVLEGDYSVGNGQINVFLPNADPMAAYQMIITPVGQNSSDSVVSKTRYEAENAIITDCQIVTLSPNPLDLYGSICSGNKKVGYISENTSKVNFTINASASGRYKVDIYYANGFLDWSEQWVRLNGGAWEKIKYKSTRVWDEIGISTVYLNLNSGNNTLEFAAYNSTGGWAQNTVDLDCIDITYAPDTVTTQRYEAEDAQTTGSPAIEWTNSGYTGTGYLKFLGTSAATAQFAVVVDKADYYDVNTSYSAGTYESYSGNRTMELYVDKVKVKDCVFSPSTIWTTWNTKSEVIYLQKGINLLTYKSNVYDDYSGVINLNNIEVTYNGSTTGIISVEAETMSNILSGTASITNNSNSSGGQYVSSLGNGSNNFIEFNVGNVVADGLYKINFCYSSSYATSNAFIEVNGTHTNDVQYFPYTCSNNIFENNTIIRPLNKGNNTIKLSCSWYNVPNIDYIEIIPIVQNNVFNTYEAEDAQIGGTVSINSNAVCSDGRSVVNIGNGTANYLQFNNIVSNTISKYRLTIYYLSNSSSAIDLTINGGSSAALILPKTGISNDLGSATFEITLNSGLNYLTFNCGTGYYAPEIDKIESIPIVYEAENAYLEGSVQIQSRENCSGNANVGYIAQGSSNSITFDKIFASTSANYQIKIFYSAPYNWSANISVNNGSVQIISLSSSGSWNTVSSVTAVIALERGYNTINISGSVNGYCPDIDKIEIFPISNFNIIQTIEIYAQYNFNNNDATDTGSAIKNGELVGNPIFITGRRGGTDRAIQLNGTNYIKLDSSVFKPSGNFTISFWIQMSPSTIMNANQRIISTGVWENATPGIVLGINNNSSGWSNVFSGIGGSGASNFQWGNSSSLLNDNTWHHIAGVFNTTTKQITVYLDGTLKANYSYSSTENVFTNQAYTAIGGHLNGNTLSEGFKGNLDDILVIKSALTPEQIGLLVSGNLFGPINFGNYMISNTNNITNLSLGTTVLNFKNMVSISNGVNILFKNENTLLGDNDIIKTGTSIIVNDNGLEILYTAIIFGDVNKDGEIDIDDLVSVKKHLLNIQLLQGDSFKAANIYIKNKISISCLLAIKKHILNIKEINQNSFLVNN